METTIIRLYRDYRVYIKVYIGMMETKMETMTIGTAELSMTLVYQSTIAIIAGFLHKVLRVMQGLEYQPGPRP